MKTIGLIGGMSWQSSLEYYRIINETVKLRLGGLHSAKCILYSVDFEEINRLQHQDQWENLTVMMVDAAGRLQAAGADLLLICANTMHKMADEVQAGVTIPLLHIADAAGDAIVARSLRKVGLLGTKYTMEHAFYKGRLENKFGLEVVVPNEPDRQTVHDIIYDELCKGIITAESKEKYLQIIGRLAAKGAQGIIFGCTEIALLINQSDCTVPVFDTTNIHAVRAVDNALQ